MTYYKNNAKSVEFATQNLPPIQKYTNNHV